MEVVSRKEESIVGRGTIRAGREPGCCPGGAQEAVLSPDGKERI